MDTSGWPCCRGDACGGWDVLVLLELKLIILPISGVPDPWLELSRAPSTKIQLLLIQIDKFNVFSVPDPWLKLYRDPSILFKFNDFFPKFSTLKIFQIKPYCIASRRKHEPQFVQLGKKWTYKRLKINEM
jgi:hypothetical protein